MITKIDTQKTMLHVFEHTANSDVKPVYKTNKNRFAGVDDGVEGSSGAQVVSQLLQQRVLLPVTFLRLRREGKNSRMLGVDQDLCEMSLKALKCKNVIIDLERGII